MTHPAPSQHEIQAVEAAAKLAEGFISNMIPETAQVGGAKLLISAADGAKDQSNSGRFAAAKAALTKAIADAGQAGQISDAQIVAIVTGAMYALWQARHHPGPSKPTLVR